MLVKTGNKIDAVAAANDGLANAVVSALKAQKLKPIPLSGQDATPAGRPEHPLGLADDDRLQGRARKPLPLRQPRSPSSRASRSKTTGTVKNGKKDEKAILIPPTSITKANYKLLFTDKFLKRSEVCVGAYKALCK